jgi:flagellar biosynthesis protein FlhG
VTTPEPTAITDAYAMIKIITQRRGLIKEATAGDEPVHGLKLLVNMVQSSMQAEDVMERILLVIKRFLNTTVEFGGYILKDERVSEAIITQSPLVLSYPHSKASKCIALIAEQIINKRSAVHGTKPSIVSCDKTNNAARNKTQNFFSEVIQWGQKSD